MRLIPISRLFGASILAAAVLAAAPPAGAGELAVPSGETILTVSGRVAATNGGGVAAFDRAMLEALGTETVTTVTPWFDGPVTFEGVPAKAVMDAVAASGETVTAIALNDYATEIPVEDFERYGVILALKRDGQYMSVRDKGPLFVIYPYDSDEALQSQTYYNRSAWQLSRLVVE